MVTVNITGTVQFAKMLKNSHPAVRSEMEQTVETEEFYSKMMPFNVMLNCKGRQL
jgi:hypothetical protein